MVFRWLADLAVIAHAAFIIFVVLGGLLVWRRPAWAWLHVPAAAWGAIIEWTGWVCPLTPLESSLRVRAGESGYQSGFIEHYLLPVLYPPGLTRGAQVFLGVLVVLVNVVFYTVAWKRYRQRERS